MSGTDKVDLRVQKTERALMGALTTLLKNKPFEDITVSDLCQAATIRRATFYKHYHDKYDFMDFCIEKKRQDFERACAVCGAQNPLDETMAVLQMVLAALRENESFLQRSAFGPMNGPMGLFARFVNRSMERKLLEMQKSGTELPAPPALIAAFLSGALLQTSHWYYAQSEGLSEEAFLYSVRQLLSLCMPATKDDQGGTP